MAHRAPRVRPATEADLPILLALASELGDALVRGADASTRPRTPAASSVLEQRYREALGSEDRHLVLVIGGSDEPLGMALLTVAPANALLELPAVHLSHSVVSRRYERRGAGRALVAAAAAFAEERGIDQLVVSVHPGSRDSNRFFARLGFAPLAVRRVAPVAVVRRALAQADRGTTDHLARRRPVRGARRASSSALPLGHAEPEPTTAR